jgi:hypothetical protein
MPKRNMDELSSDAKLWAFAASRRLSEEESAALESELDSFFSSWTSHGAPVNGSAELRDRILLLVGAEEYGNPSGCSIDKLFSLLRSKGESIGIDFVDSGRVVWRDSSGGINSASRAEFRKLVEERSVSRETTVVDLAVENISDLRNGRIERRAADSWHASAFPFAV